MIERGEFVSGCESRVVFFFFQKIDYWIKLLICCKDLLFTFVYDFYLLVKKLNGFLFFLNESLKNTLFLCLLFL